MIEVKFLKVTDFGTNRKPTPKFLLVINTNLHPILHRFDVIADLVWEMVTLHFWAPFGDFLGNAR